MNKNDIIEKLINVEKTKQSIPFFKHANQMTESDCYAIQKELVKHKEVAFKSKLGGYKISMTSSETQKIADTFEPAFGRFLADDIQTEKQTIKLNELLEPLIEPELVFHLKDDLSPEAAHAEIIHKSTIQLGAEIPDSRYSNWFPNFNLADLICDNAFAGKLVLSEAVFPAQEVAFKDIHLKLFHDNELIGEGTSGNVLDNPLNAVQWLNQKLQSQGNRLTKGKYISSGTFTNPFQLSQGKYTLEFSGLGSMEIECI